MKTIKHEWWATPVWEVEDALDDNFAERFMDELNKCKPKSEGSSFNLWDYTTPAILQLKFKMLNTVKECCTEYFPDWVGGFKPILTRSWVSTQRPGESLVLHDHGSSLIACVYYLNAPENSGDLILVDPRGGVNWDWQKEGDITKIKFKRVTPQKGKLVFFPAYLLHYVETNKSNETRMSVATNIINGVPQ